MFKSKHGQAILICFGILAVLLFGYKRFYSFFDKDSSVPDSHQYLEKLEREGLFGFELPRLEGGTYSSKSLSGHVVLLNFWASWCGPCVEEFPSLIELAKKQPQLLIVAISGDKDLQSLNAFLKAFEKRPKNMVVVVDSDQRVAHLYGADVLPESYVFSKTGGLIRKIAGAQKWNDPNALDYFSQLNQ